jgi:ankyrin repeat protein
VPLIKLLLSHGAKVNAKDGQGSTPLHRAASAGRQEAVRALLEAPDLKIDATDKQVGAVWGIAWCLPTGCCVLLVHVCWVLNMHCKLITMCSLSPQAAFEHIQLI